MNYKFLKFFIMAIGMVVMTACEKEDPANADPSPENLAPFAMTYVDFITPTDVQILSEDTTSISVSKEFAQKMGIEVFKNRAVTIWRTIGTVPFIRIITDARESNGEIILTTKRGEFSDMFENLEASLVSDLYVNHDYAASRTTRNALGEEMTDVSDKYMDQDSVYHPAVIIVDEDSPMARSMKSRTGSTKNYFTAEELLAQNATFNILDIQSDFMFDFRYPVDEDDDDFDDEATGIHLKGKAGIEAELSAYTNISIGFFRLKKFEAGVKGSAGIATKLSLGLQYKAESKWEQEIMPVGGHIMVFWVGPIPVPLVYESSIVQRAEASASASVEVLATAKYELSFEQGCLYESGNGWRNVSKETKSTKSFNFDGIRGAGKLEAMAGIFYEMGIYVGGSVGPEFSFGPALSAEAGVEATYNPVSGDVDVEAEVGAYAGLSGEIGAKIKVLGYNIAKWETTFDVFKLTLYRGRLSWSFTSDSWGELETEWTNIMNQDTHEWDFGSGSRLEVPYRIPEQAQNF